METPPRTWRRLTVEPQNWLGIRNTSTDVEKTKVFDRRPLKIKKHLHGRGEDLSVFSKTLMVLETPPRTWRRQNRCP